MDTFFRFLNVHYIDSPLTEAQFFQVAASAQTMLHIENKHSLIVKSIQISLTSLENLRALATFHRTEAENYLRAQL